MDIQKNSLDSNSSLIHRFQEARTSARKKLRATELRENLTKLLTVKNEDFSTPHSDKNIQIPNRSNSVGLKPGVAVVARSLEKANDLLMYSREKITADSKSNRRFLGNYVDMVV